MPLINLMTTRLLIRPLLGFASALIGHLHAEDAAAPVTLTALNSMERLVRGQTAAGQAEAAIKSARNEVESVQVIVSAPSSKVTITNATVSDLRGPNGTLGREHVQLFREVYVSVQHSTLRATLPPGDYPDGLIPFHAPADSAAAAEATPALRALPIELDRGEQQPIWVDITVPRDAKPGVYRGTFTVTLAGGRSAALPLSVTVWDFALPDGPTHRTKFFELENIAGAFGVERNSDRYREIERRYCRLMAEHRINPPLPRSLLPETQPDGSLKITPGRHAALQAFVREFHVTDFPIPRFPLKDLAGPDREKAVRHYREWHEYVKKSGWAGRAYVYVHDEPNSHEAYETTLAHGRLIAEAAPGLKRAVTEQPYPQDPGWPDIDPAVDIWCPLFSFIDRGAVNRKLAQGDEVWSYTALAQRARPYHPSYDRVKDFDPPYWHVDQPLTAYRVPTWINWQYGITGLLYWSTVVPVEKPWSNTVWASRLARDGRYWNGEGFLIYPGRQAGIEGPCPSLRLKNIRDGLEDYEYFALLAKRRGRERSTALVAQVAPEWWGTATDPKTFLRVREAIANEITR